MNYKLIQNPRDLPGFRKKSFAMYFRGGEIWFEHLDGIYEYEALVLESCATIFRCLRNLPQHL